MLLATYSDGLEEIKARCLFSYIYYGSYTQLHVHDYWEFIVVISGSYAHTLNGISKQATQNTAYVLRPMIDSHCLKSVAPNTKHLTIRIDHPIMRKVCDSISPTFYDELLKSDNLEFYLSDSQVKRIVDYTTIWNNKISEIKDEMLAFFILSYILEKIFYQNILIKNDMPQWLVDLILQIKSPSNMSWTIEDVVRHCNFSHAHLLRLFKKYTGYTLIEFMTETKMRHACELLTHSDYSILQIALSLGYSDSSHLTRVFKKIYDMTPSEYRRQYLTRSSEHETDY